MCTLYICEYIHYTYNVWHYIILINEYSINKNYVHFIELYAVLDNTP